MESAAPTTSGHILDAATRLFAERGYEGVSLQAVADKVGIRKQSLLHHFPSKDALREAALQSILAYWDGALPTALMRATGGEDRFEAALAVLTDFFSADRHRALLVVREFLDRPEEMAATLGEKALPWVRMVTAYIRRGQRTGEVIATVDPEPYVLNAAILHICLIAGATVFEDIAAREGAGAMSLRRLLNEAARAFRQSLFTPGQRPAAEPAP